MVSRQANHRDVEVGIESRIDDGGCYLKRTGEVGSWLNKQNSVCADETAIVGRREV
jgi:hypothetical protein